MCVFHVTSETNSFAAFLKETAFPVYQTREKGDVCTIGKRQPYEYYGFSSVVSEKEWFDLAGQIEDAYAFLVEHEATLRALTSSHVVDDLRLDFPYSCRLGEQIYAQIDYLPPKFLLLAGKLGIGIKLSHYLVSEEELSE